MAKRLKLILSLLLLCSAPAGAQVQFNAISNVFQLHTPAGFGSAFTMTVDNRQYLITAKHMVRGLKTDGSLESVKLTVLKEAGTADSRPTLTSKAVSVRIFACKSPVDIAVLIPSELVRLTPTLEAVPDDMAIGQEGYFLGFPLGYAMTVGGANFPFPVPFTKKGTLSNIDYSEQADLMLFDGYNNFGFSGGPVVYQEKKEGTKSVVGTFYVAAVISGFIPELIPNANWRLSKPSDNLSQIEEWRIKKQDGKTYILEDAKTVVPTNTGIIAAYNIHHALDVIKEHPIGPTVGLDSHPAAK